MKKIIKIILFTVLLQSIIAHSSSRHNHYDDPASRSQHRALKTIKERDAKKLEFQHSNIKKIMNVKPFKVSRIFLENPTEIDFSDTYKKYIDKVITNNEIQSIISKINNQLNNEGYILSFAYAPKQNLYDGILNLQIIHGKIRDVKVVSDTPVENNKLFNSYIDNILNMSPVMNADLQKNIQLINQIPGYEAQYNLEPLKDQQYLDEIVDLVLVIDKKNMDLSLASNNQGSKSIGKYQFSSLINLYNSLGENERITVYTGTSNKPSALKIGTIDFEKFINSNGTSINLLVSHIQDNPYVVLPGNADDNLSTMYKASLNHYLYLTHNKSLQLVGGYEYRNSDNYMPGVKVSDSKYGNVFIGANIEFPDFIEGENFAALHHYQSIKNQTTNNKYNVLADNIDLNYNFSTIELFRNQKLPENFSLFSQLLGQYSNNELPLDQKFFIGGLSVGRGYINGLASSDRGIDFGTELRYTHNLKQHSSILKEMEPYIFYDIAKISKKSANSNKSTLQSAGLGLRMKTKYDFNFIFEGGFPFKKDIMINNQTVHNSNKFSFLLNKTFEF